MKLSQLRAVVAIAEHGNFSGLAVPYERAIGVAILANALHTPAVFAFLDALKKFASKPCAN